ncbi:MAG: glycosyltransferase family 4 protein [Pseudomonadota bacterium]
MNILYIGFDVEGVGGIATYSRHQIRALRDLGHRVHVLSIDKQSLKMEHGYADRNVAFLNKYRAVPAVLRFLLARRGRFDLVVVNHVYLAGFGLAARLLTGSPYVVNVYNIDILKRLSAPREYAFAHADLAIADCQYTIERMPRFHRRMPPVGLLYDPVDTAFFRPIAKLDARREIERRFDLEDLDGRFVAATVAHLAEPPNKGHRQMIEALRLLDDPRFLYLVVGEGPDRLAIADHAARNGVSSQVKFLGFVEQSALPFLYSAADVAVLVSRGGPGLGEAVPFALIEAASCGVPVICGDQDGAIEAIDPAHPNGLAVDPDRPEELARRLRALADDAAAVAELGGNGTRFVDEVFQYRKFVERQGELLSRFLGPATEHAPARPGGAVPAPATRPTPDHRV